MNRIIILISFFLVSSFHILLFTYYKNYQIFEQKLSTNSTIQINLKKVVALVEKKELVSSLTQNKNKKEEKKDKKIEKIAKPKEIKELTKNKENNSAQKEKINPIENIEKPTETVSKNIDIDLEKEKKEEVVFIDNYGKKLRDEINRNKKYPTISKKLKEQGKVIVRFRVLKNGKFDNIHILVSSNNKRLDNAALNALYDTKEYEPFNEKIKKDFIEYNLPLEFILD